VKPRTSLALSGLFYLLVFEPFGVAQGPNPSQLYDLATTHDQAGHSVAAMFWFRAYLLAKPGAPDLSAVSAQISRLDRSARTTEHDLYDKALVEAKSHEDRNGNPLLAVAMRQAGAGYIQSALSQLNDDQDVDLLWMEAAKFSVWLGDLDGARNSLAHVREFAAGVSRYCDESASAHRWDRLSRQQVEDHFLRCSTNVFGPEFPYCAVWHYPFAREAIRAIHDDGIRQDAENFLGSLIVARDCSRISPLQIWIEYARKAPVFDLGPALTPDALRRASFDNPAGAAGVIADFAWSIARSLALFHVLESRLR